MRLLPKDSEIAWTPYAYLVYLGGLFFTPLFSGQAVDWLITITAAAVFLPLYFRGWWLGGKQLLPYIIAISFLGIALIPINPGAGCFFIYAAAFAGEVGRPRIAGSVVALIALTATAESMILGHHILQWIWAPLFTIVVGAMCIHFAQVRRHNAKVRMAQEEIEHLAKVAERERIARDLHDLLGHTLSLIILKSELATKLISTDQDRALGEMRDVERISRETLKEVREAVRGYRSAGLKEQLGTATSTLKAAGIEVVADIEEFPIPAVEEAVLSMAIREAATNIVRHAGAHHCTVRLERNEDTVRLEIIDDGRGGDFREGAGLAGMRERLEAIGGRLEVSGMNGTRLVITLPVTVADVLAFGERTA